MAEPPVSVHHVATVTREPEAVRSFLVELLGFNGVAKHEVGADDAASLLDWPASSSQDVVGLDMIGGGASGLVEVIAIPDDLDELKPGIALLSIAVRDVEGILDEARARGLDCVGPRSVISKTMHLTVGLITVGGIKFELVRFEKDKESA